MLVKPKNYANLSNSNHELHVNLFFSSNNLSFLEFISLSSKTTGKGYIHPHLLLGVGREGWKRVGGGGELFSRKTVTLPSLVDCPRSLRPGGGRGVGFEEENRTCGCCVLCIFV